MIHMLDSWLKSDTSYSWSDVITALRDIHENTLADELESSTIESIAELPGMHVQ